MRHRAASAAVVAMLLATVAGCERRPTGKDSSQTHAPDSTSALQDRVAHPQIAAAERDARPLRILSTAPNVTEVCCALGLAGQLVGRTRYCAHPPAVRDVPTVGDLYNLNLEVLLAIKPDLILISGRSRAISDRLEQLGLQHESLPDASLQDLFGAIELAGELTGRPATAGELIAGIRADLESVRRRFTSGPSRHVLLSIGPLPDPPQEAFVAGPGSFYDDLLRLAGHENVAQAAGRPFSPMSLEYVAQADPDVIIELAADLATRPQADEDARRVWSQIGPLKAVRDRRVHVLVGQQHLIPGPRIAMTFEALCKTIAGEND